jgi:hypothetical protein
MTDLIERIRRIIEQHREVERDDADDAPGVACGCLAKGLSDHPRHVSEEIVERLQLRPESNKVRNEIRYASAWFDDELTKLEGTE